MKTEVRFLFLILGLGVLTIVFCLSKENCWLPNPYTFTLGDLERVDLPRRINWQVNDGFLLDNIELNCDAAFDDVNSTEFQRLKKFKFNETLLDLELKAAENVCPRIFELFFFPQSPNSGEEGAFPIAYGIVIHHDIIQPQNEYVIAVDAGSTKEFQALAKRIATCFNNVQVFITGPVKWMGREVMDAVWGTLRVLAASPTPWRYFQYLSGVDAPLRTNLEMVRIFKAMNGSPNLEVSEFEDKRLHPKNITKKQKTKADNGTLIEEEVTLRSYPPNKFEKEDSPLPLFKSSMSVVFSRETADFLVQSPIVADQLAFLRPTQCPDESMWLTLLGNKNRFLVPGSFEAAEWLEQAKRLKIKTSLAGNTTYYVARYQVWDKEECTGLMTSGSCVFGVGDLPRILSKPHIIAHKFYMNIQPAAYFCVLKEIQRRTAYPDDTFSTEYYENLPLVQIQNGRRTIHDFTEGI